MISLKIPLEVGPQGLRLEDDAKKAIDDSLHLLITTSLGECKCNSEYGFIFNNMSFENFNETDGTVYNSQPDSNGIAEQKGLYHKKLSGNSKDLNTFAAELKDLIRRLELRLEQVTTSMLYVRRERAIYIIVKAVVRETKQPYKYTNILKIWE